MTTPAMMLSNEQLLNRATGKLQHFVTIEPDNYWRTMFSTNLDSIKVYMNKGSDHEQSIARVACYFIIDHADYVISSIDRQRFAETIKTILLDQLH